MSDTTPRIWATVWHDPEDGYRAHTLVLLDKGIGLGSGAPLIDCVGTGITSLDHAQRHLLYVRDSVRSAIARVRFYED